jgi:hypothetical protein
VRELAGEAATPVLLLIDVTQERSGMRRARHDADLGRPRKYSYLSTTHLQAVAAIVRQPECRPGDGSSPDLRYHHALMGDVIPFPKRPPEPRDNSALVEVHRCDQREALVVKGLFESEGIPVIVRSRIAHSVHPFTVGAQGEVVLLVPRADADRSRRLLSL